MSLPNGASATVLTFKCAIWPDAFPRRVLDALLRDQPCCIIF